MGYDRSDRRYGGNDRYEDRDRYGASSSRYTDPRDRGFFDRASDEVRSWFGDEDAERRRRMDERYDDRQDRPYGGGDRYASGERGGYRSPDRYPSWSRSNEGGRARYSSGYAPTSYHYENLGAGEDRQFGDDPVRSWGDTGRGYGYGYDRGDDRDRRDEEYRAYYGGSAGGGANRNRDDDPHGYSSWRDRQVSQFDRDYDEYRRDNQSRFDSEFSQFRQKRQTQRDSLMSAKEHQEVVGSDGQHIGTVDHVRGDRILLTKADKDAGGHHHSIPSAWINKVDDKVHVLKTAEEAKRVWRDEENNGGMSGRDQSSGRDYGSHNLDRSFSGTYNDKR